MKSKIFYALLAAPVFLLGGAATEAADELAEHQRFLDRDSIIANTVSINPTECFILGDGAAAVGGDGRVFVKFDTKGFISTVTGKCNITGFEESDLSGAFAEEGFDCVVHLNGIGNDGQSHDLLECISGEDPDARNSLRVRNGKATLSCSGPYFGDVNQPIYTSLQCANLF